MESYHLRVAVACVRMKSHPIAPDRLKVAKDWLTARRQLREARLDRFDPYLKQRNAKESKP